MKAKWEILLLLLGFIILLVIVILIAYFIGWPFVGGANNLSEAVFDFWSSGHFLAGIGMFMLVFILYFIVKNVIDFTDKNNANGSETGWISSGVIEFF